MTANPDKQMHGTFLKERTRSGISMPVQLLCPYCAHPIAESTKRSQKCPACNKDFYVRRGKIFHVHNGHQLRTVQDLAVGDHQSLMREFHQRALQHFKKCADAFPFIRISSTEDNCTCAFCIAQKGKLIATDQATNAMLPPFSECMGEDGKCRCTIIAVDKEQAKSLGLL
jgi:hypothetical protein